MTFRATILSLTTIVSLMTSSLSADEPGWLNVVVARGALREQIRATPILERPYRPLHFYGNAVRRAYYRGQGSGQILSAAPSAVANAQQ
jgi:cyanate lyase